MDTEWMIRWDALFNGENKPIDRRRKPPDKIYQYLISFHERPAHIRHRPEEEQLLQKQFMEAAETIRWGISSAYTELNTGVPGRNTGIQAYARTDSNMIYDHIKIWVSAERLQPLFRTDLLDAERYHPLDLLFSQILKSGTDDT